MPSGVRGAKLPQVCFQFCPACSQADTKVRSEHGVLISKPVTSYDHDRHCIDVTILIAGDGVYILAAFKQEVPGHFAFIFVERVPTDHTSDREFFIQEVVIFKVHTPETHFTSVIIHFTNWN